MVKKMTTVWFPDWEGTFLVGHQSQIHPAFTRKHMTAQTYHKIVIKTENRPKNEKDAFLYLQAHKLCKKEVKNEKDGQKGCK